MTRRGEVNAQFVETMLRCPINRGKLRIADKALLAAVNRAIAAGKARFASGEVVAEPLEAGLVREDGAVLYRVVEGVPTLLCDEALLLAEIFPTDGHR
ncbi:MAG: Trm112 family protein [Planctomycetia bacterium]|nr:Trm112 family protein [Planctomycetia bacterium]